MTADVAHRLVEKLSIERDGELVRLRAGDAVVTGTPELLVALDLLCSQPRPRELVRQRPELGVAVGRLCDAGWVVPVNHPAPAERHRGFDDPTIHVRMLDDAARTAAYLDAIAGLVRPGDVVVDLGTGCGVLAVAAAKAGARRVFAIEAGEMACLAERLALANGVGDRVEVVRGWSTRADLPERANALITETIGNEPLGESILELVQDARRRFLLPDARVIPNSLRLSVELLWVPNEQGSALGDRAASALARGGRDGLELAALTRLTQAPGFRVESGSAQSWPRLSDPTPLVTLDLARHETAVVDATTRVTTTQGGSVNGAVVSAEVVLAPGLSVFTGRRGPENSWSAWVHRVPATRVRAGETLTVRYHRGLGGARVEVTR
ncbi:MAG: 50S ribosomal protein L11 methyltransferase [Polyangiaceae bacterium]|nr:50S ribosomal protein L11 methyltransferase [Polyangiaceae bacterium]